MRLLRRIFLIGFAATMLTFSLPEKQANADDYWNSYWGWYDGNYRPYYQRHYRRYGYAPQYYGTYDPYYSYSPGYYYPSYGYGYPAYGYGYYYGRPYNSVQVGPLRFGWR
jgi:hypothetical protein